MKTVRDEVGEFSLSFSVREAIAAVGLWLWASLKGWFQ